MIYAIGFYWLCAGFASFKIDRGKGMGFMLNLILSLALGGVLVPVRILAKLAA